MGFSIMDRVAKAISKGVSAPHRLSPEEMTVRLAANEKRVRASLLSMALSHPAPDTIFKVFDLDHRMIAAFGLPATAWVLEDGRMRLADEIKTLEFKALRNMNLAYFELAREDGTVIVEGRLSAATVKTGNTVYIHGIEISAS